MISGEDGSSYVLTTQLDIHANHRYILSLNKDHTVSIAVADYTNNAEQGVTEAINKTFGIVAEPANLKNGEFYPMLNVISVEDPALEFNADFTIRSTSAEGIEVAISGDAGIVEDITVDKKGLVTRAPYYANTFSVKFAAGKFASDKEFRTVLQIKDKASAATFDIVIFHSDGTETPTPPEDGPVAPTGGILSVDENGVLNLDGDGKIVYFKWGSLIAISPNSYGDVFGIEDVAWAPAGYNYAALVASIGLQTANEAWAKIPYTKEGDQIIVDLAAGTGDPCALAVKAKANEGDFRMPTGNPYEQYDNTTATFKNVNGQNGVEDATNNMFYPIVGGREPNAGATYGLNRYGAFWTSSAKGGVYHLGFDYIAGTINRYTATNRLSGMAIRCVRK